MKLIPKNGWLIVRAIPEDKVTKTGIIIPEGVERDESAVMQGEVLFSQDRGDEIGVVSTSSPTTFRIADIYKPGDTILFSKFLPMDFEYEKEKVWCIKESDIIAKLE